MKKIVFIVLIFSITPRIFSQTLNERIKGTWYHCHKDLGYIEMTVYDTILSRKFMLNDFVINSPLIYSVQDSIIKINPGHPDIYEEINVNMINNETMILSGFTYENDTLNLINRKIPDYYKAPCEMNMTPIQYSEYLKAEYRLRRIKNRHKCISSLYKKRKDDNQLVVNEKLPKEIVKIMSDTTRVSVISSLIDYQVINKNKNKKIEFVDLIQNDNKGTALLIIDVWGKCYVDYNHYIKIINDKMIDVVLKPIETKCNKECRKRLYIDIFKTNYTIKGVSINGEIIK